MSDLSDFEDDDDRDESATSVFNRATNFVQKKVDQIDQNNLLELYGLFKQATVGKCNTAKPGMLNFQAKAKWAAWNKLGDMPAEKSMEMYITILTRLFPDEFDPNEEVNSKESSWVAVSSMLSKEEDIPEGEKDIFDYIKESNIQQLKTSLQQDASAINSIDESGMGLIHWASDRGDAGVLEILLKSGADVNLRDADGQTGLHYASSCGNVDCVRVLMKYKPNLSITDNDSQTCIQVAENETIINLLQ